ncbi:O-antigen ligase family protein [Marinilactibacillus psychrotolerans]|uniref:DUF308 domain-containing protein n=1 Tax=Marinilactibacillus psychrotolerans TaxID=191770 RepID=A0AAV3WVH0_9LACT|nr:O-antigen ligase family protein [Marinilactibacillus psychrotolerans]GEL67917.1 hypothetical protein MPS01_20720 [Marinilactibacillus psychrotolerans]GEQ36137.1 hypothetical protein M132T_16450 [Marinilactibacillus psychrotolerans]SDC65637.1 hypothetical protein SAMN04488013_107149 [Marinilactibacillus psychrotolerans]
MKNIKAIFWLISFFPIGLYYMFKETNWSTVTKIIISLIGMFILGIAVSTGSASVLLVLSGLIIFFSAILYFIYSILKKNHKRPAVLLFIFGILLMGIGGTQISAENAEAERVAEEQKLEEEKIETDRIAEEKRLEVEEKTELAIAAIEKVTETLSKNDYKAAEKAIEDIPEPNKDLSNKLKKLQDPIKEYEIAVNDTAEAIKKAEESKSRADYEHAISLSDALPIGNNKFDSRLAKIDETITKSEAEKAKKELLAKEESERKAEEERTQAASKNNNSPTENYSEESKNETEKKSSNDNITKTVYVATQSGKKYHFDPNCRGLSNANSVDNISLDVAISQGYDLCGWED